MAIGRKFPPDSSRGPPRAPGGRWLLGVTYNTQGQGRRTPITVNKVLAHMLLAEKEFIIHVFMIKGILSRGKFTLIKRGRKREEPSWERGEMKTRQRRERKGTPSSGGKRQRGGGEREREGAPEERGGSGTQCADDAFLRDRQNQWRRSSLPNSYTASSHTGMASRREHGCP